MTLKGIIDRKIILMICAPILRRLGTALAVYLTAKGAPEDLLQQMLTALGVVLGLAFDIALATVAKHKTENAAKRSILDALDKRSADDAFYEAHR